MGLNRKKIGQFIYLIRDEEESLKDALMTIALKVKTAKSHLDKEIKELVLDINSKIESETTIKVLPYITSARIKAILLESIDDKSFLKSLYDKKLPTVMKEKLIDLLSNDFEFLLRVLQQEKVGLFRNYIEKTNHLGMLVEISRKCSKYHPLSAKVHGKIAKLSSNSNHNSYSYLSDISLSDIEKEDKVWGEKVANQFKDILNKDDNHTELKNLFEKIRLTDHDRELIDNLLNDLQELKS